MRRWTSCEELPVKSAATTVEEYLAELPEGRREAVSMVRDVVNEHLPEGYAETMEWGMVSWVVPLDDYPDTYNGRPLSYVSLASQKNYLALYLLGLYTDGPEEQRFRARYVEQGMKLDMGKSCVRFKTVDELHLDAVAEAVAGIEPGELIARYEASRAR
jgi:hypothetical protein